MTLGLGKAKAIIIVAWDKLSEDLFSDDRDRALASPSTHLINTSFVFEERVLTKDWRAIPLGNGSNVALYRRARIGNFHVEIMWSPSFVSTSLQTWIEIMTRFRC
jgi:hypothetical protein